MPDTAQRPAAAATRRQVPLLDLKAQYREFRAEVLPIIERF